MAARKRSKLSCPKRPKLFGRFPDEITFADGYVAFKWEWPGAVVEILACPGGAYNWEIDFADAQFLLGTAGSFVAARNALLASVGRILKSLRTVVEGK